MIYKDKIIHNKVIINVYKDTVMAMLPSGEILTAGTVKGIQRKIKNWIKREIKPDETWLTTTEYTKCEG